MQEARFKFSKLSREYGLALLTVGLAVASWYFFSKAILTLEPIWFVPALILFLGFSALLIILALLVDSSFLKWLVASLAALSGGLFFARNDIMIASAAALAALLIFRVACGWATSEAKLLRKLRISRISRGPSWLILLALGLFFAAGVISSPFGQDIARAPIPRPLFQTVYDFITPAVSRFSGLELDGTVEEFLRSQAKSSDPRIINILKKQYEQRFNLVFENKTELSEVLYNFISRQLDLVRPTMVTFLPLTLLVTALVLVRIFRTPTWLLLVIFINFFLYVLQLLGLIRIEAVPDEREVMHFSSRQ